MNSEQQPITGAEAIGGESLDIYAPLNCLREFYRAFNQRDLAHMASNWSHLEQASMSNPLGDIKRGWPAIQAVYERIFSGPAQVYVEFYDYSLHVTAEMFCAVGRERGYVAVAGQRLDLAIRTTRIYHRENLQWKQLHHHGSMDNADLLARYQDAVKALVADP